MEQKLQKSGLATASLILGLVSFIPLVGVLLGILAVILGIISLKQIKKMNLGGKKMAISGIILGLLGIIFTFAMYGLLFYYGSVSKTGPFAELKPQASQQILIQNAGALELYKKQNGRYPNSLDEATTAGLTIFPTDHYFEPFFYKASEDGRSYELRSLGADGEYGTADDIFPVGQ
ncbi:MAG: DUF4190 domain-containing protein [Candidatus Paceibacterota bacterium]